jgi:hypothetical protein
MGERINMLEFVPSTHQLCKCMYICKACMRMCWKFGPSIKSVCMYICKACLSVCVCVCVRVLELALSTTCVCVCIYVYVWNAWSLPVGSFFHPPTRYVYIYIYIYIYVHVLMCIVKFLELACWSFLLIIRCVDTYVCLPVYMYVCIHIYIYIYIYIYICMHKAIGVCFLLHIFNVYECVWIFSLSFSFLLAPRN